MLHDKSTKIVSEFKNTSVRFKRKMLSGNRRDVACNVSTNRSVRPDLNCDFDKIYKIKKILTIKKSPSIQEKQ